MVPGCLDVCICARQLPRPHAGIRDVASGLAACSSAQMPTWYAVLQETLDICIWLPGALRTVLQREDKRRERFTMTTDPVCGMQLDEQQAAVTSTYQGKMYYFCSVACKRQFDQNPQRYISQQSGHSQHARQTD